ncbi:glutathione binding-like protein [Congregibacter sp.]|uniref:glutathione binding-like protein n=1 Tax=Congregibacter sp. TaxID=2744308 RepID=UPI003F6C6E2E
MLGYGSCEKTYQTLLCAMTDTTYICGDRFTAADVCFGSEVMFGLQFKSLTEHPLLCNYRGRLSEREAYQRAAALNDAALTA